MKHSTRRTIPPPIDLTIPGSNLWGNNSRRALDKSSTRGRHAYAYGSEYALESEEAMLSRATLTATPTLWSPSSTSETMPTPSNPHTPMTSLSSTDHSFTSEQDDSTPSPNGRRRSRSECGYQPRYPPALSQSASPNSRMSSPFSSRFPHTPSSSSQSFLPESTPPLASNVTPKLKKGSTSADALAMMGKRNKLWSSITSLTSNASAVLELGNKTPVKEKVRKPGISPAPSPSYTPSIDSEGSDTGRAAGIDMWKRRRGSRPSTASSANSSTSRSPLRLSKFEWPKQWKKRLSLLKLSSSPSPASSASSHSSTPSTSSTYSSSSPNLPSTPLTPTSGHRCSHPLVSLQDGHGQDLLQTSNKRNRSTPNLKLPHLTKEDLGKVNAYFAPPPSVTAVEALNNFPRHRTTSSDPKAMKSTLALSSGGQLPKMPSNLKPPLPPVTIQPASSVHHERGVNDVSNIALPLSPVSNASWNDMEDDSGVIYLTVVEDDWNDASGEAGLRLVEIPR